MFDNSLLILLLYGEKLKLKIKLKFLHNQADGIAGLLSELAKVVVQEKFLLQEFNDIFHTMCLLQVAKCCFSYSFDNHLLMMFSGLNMFLVPKL